MNYWVSLKAETKSVHAKYAHGEHRNYVMFCKQICGRRLSLMSKNVYQWALRASRGDTTVFCSCIKILSCHICGCWGILYAYKPILIKTCHRLIPEGAEKKNTVTRVKMKTYRREISNLLYELCKYACHLIAYFCIFRSYFVIFFGGAQIYIYKFLWTKSSV